MKKIKILSVFGTRPEATKMAPLVLALERREDIVSQIAVTAQHRELLDKVLDPLGIQPRYDLNIMKAGQSLADVTSRVLYGLGAVIEEAAPDLLLVHGDTGTTFAAALAAFYARVRVGHVEAGLRTYDKFQPYPEEMNRKLTTALADLYFAPTERARENLLKENIDDRSIYVTGNTAVDFTAYTTRENYSFQNEALRARFNSPHSPGDPRIIVMTAHRNENRGGPFESICRAVRRLADNFDDIQLIWPMHPNPLVTETARQFLSDHPRVALTENIDVFDMHNLLRRAYLVLTDSGGLQEEAPAFHLPTVVMREVTERPEGLTAGTLMLAGTDEQVIYKSVADLLADREKYKAMAFAPNPFGDGEASERIVEAIRYYFKHTDIRPKSFGWNK